MRKKVVFSIMVALTALVLLGCPNPVTPPDTVIDITAIAGVTAPATGAMPVTTITETAQYTGTVNWSPAVSGTFVASTVYTATITLTAKVGYTLTGVTANSFTVAGATATHPAGSGVVEAVFPATDDGSYTSPNIGTLVYVPAGRFQRDGTASNISVITQPYRMSRHQITRAQFQAIMDDDPSDNDRSSNGASSPDDPVQRVNWYHAIAFSNKLSIAEGLDPVYVVTGVDFGTLTFADIPTSGNDDWNAATATWTNNGYRLPTEMEWMWAAMGAPADGQGGGTNTTGYTKAFAGSTGSNAIRDYAVYGMNSGPGGTEEEPRTTRPVGSKFPNELGLYDMTGNVWEWTWDWREEYPSGTETDYRGAASGTRRVLRGGAWNTMPFDSTVALRGPFRFPHSQGSVDGFRVVRP